MIRYHALALSAASLAVAATVAALTLNPPSTPRRDPRPDALSLPPLSSAAQNAQNQLTAGLHAMAALQSLTREPPPASRADASPLLATPAPGTAVAGAVQLPQRSLQVFLHSLADDRTIVALDGQLVERGSRLSEGGRVGAARPFELHIIETQGRQRLDMAVQRLSVGTLRWSDGTPASVATPSFRRPGPGARPEATP